MALPVPALDDRRFQDIVDQAKTMIPQFCPEWTDHNVSDPGVALIELFAWMTDMLLYRVNQVPDRMYVKFLELIGVQLQPPRAAEAPLTFYLSAAQPVDVVIPEGTEVATVRTETSPAITFTTESALTIRPAHSVGAYTRRPQAGAPGTWTAHDLRELVLPGRKIKLFPETPAPGDGFYLALDKDHGNQVLALNLACEAAGGAGVDPNDPPLAWQVWQGEPTRWAACEVEHDGTGGFNYSGEVILHLPAMIPRDFQDGAFHAPRSYWLRCQIVEPRPEQRMYRVSPAVEGLRIEGRGGTVMGRHATVVEDELLGVSDGSAGQSFTLLHAPVLALDPERDYIVSDGVGLPRQPWSYVEDFGDSAAEDRCFTLDHLTGKVTFGPALLQPDGTVYRFGAAPPKGSTLRFKRYQYGGGVAGNVPREMLRVLRQPVPYVQEVANRRAARGGADAQSLEDAKLRAPQKLRTRTRAVTADDFEYLAAQAPGVARARCIAPGAQPGNPEDAPPGQVYVLILPRAEVGRDGRYSPEQLALSAELRAAVLRELEQRRLVGTLVEVRQPHYLWVSVNATLQVPAGSHPGLVREVREQAERALYQFLNPHTGGPKGDGWPYGRDLNVPELYSLLQRLPSVELVEEVQVSIDEGESGTARRAVDMRLTLPPHSLVCSGQHQVTVNAR